MLSIGYARLKLVYILQVLSFGITCSRYNSIVSFFISVKPVYELHALNMFLSFALTLFSWYTILYPSLFIIFRLWHSGRPE